MMHTRCTAFPMPFSNVLDPINTRKTAKSNESADSRCLRQAQAAVHAHSCSCQQSLHGALGEANIVVQQHAAGASLHQQCTFARSTGCAFLRAANLMHRCVLHQWHLELEYKTHEAPEQPTAAQLHATHEVATAMQHRPNLQR